MDSCERLFHQMSKVHFHQRWNVEGDWSEWRYCWQLTSVDCHLHAVKRATELHKTYPHQYVQSHYLTDLSSSARSFSWNSSSRVLSTCSLGYKGFARTEIHRRCQREWSKVRASCRLQCFPSQGASHRWLIYHLYECRVRMWEWRRLFW